MVRNKDEGGQAELVWTCHEEILGICRKKGDENGITGKEKKRETKKRFLDVVKKDMKEVGVKETHIGKKTLWRSIICCGNP